jgi:predicted AAA+ superfamily ATPase
MYQRLLQEHLSRSRPFCLFGAKGVGKTTMIGVFAGKFSNWIHLDFETAVDRAIFNFDVPADEILKAISFLKGVDIRGNGTLIVLDEIGQCPEAIGWVKKMLNRRTGGQADKRTGGQADKRTGGQADKRTGGQADKWTGGQADGRTGGRADESAREYTEAKGPFIVATSSIMTPDLAGLTDPENEILQPYFLYPFSFGEFLSGMDDPSALDAFREVPVPYYAYEKLLHYFHVYALIGGMPEITGEYAVSRHLAGLKRIYETIEERFIRCLQGVTAGSKSRDLAVEVLQNTYPYAATRISFKNFGNLDKGSREIGQAFKALENAFLLRMIQPASSTMLPLLPDKARFPRLQMLDTGLVNYFSGIQKPLFRTHDMNAIFEGQIARQIVGQEILATGCAVGGVPALDFWTRNKAQSTAEVDFVIPYNDLLIPVSVRSGEPGRLRSLHQFVDAAPHTYAVRLYAGKLAVQQTRTLRGKKFFLLNLPYFLAGKINDHLKGFIRLANE